MLKNVKNVVRGFLKLTTLLPTPLSLNKPLKQTFNPITPNYTKQDNNLKHTNRLTISLADRWVGLGMTGTGKTTWAKELIRIMRSTYPGARVYLLDSKGQNDFDSIPGSIKIESELAPDTLYSSGGVQIWTPPIDNIGEYDKWFEKILKHRKPAIVLIDELSSIGGKTGNSFPLGFFKLQKQGRGLDISLITLSQEAAYIPRQVLGQLTHLIRFRLLDSFDSKKADKLLKRPIEHIGNEPVNPYGFIYRRVDTVSAPYEYKNWQEFFKG